MVNRKFKNIIFETIVKAATIFVLFVIFAIIISLSTSAICSLEIYKISLHTKGDLAGAIATNDDEKIKNIVEEDLKRILKDEKLGFLTSRYCCPVQDYQNGNYHINLPAHILNQNIIDKMAKLGISQKEFRYDFFTNTTSSDPRKAGIFSAFCGTIFTAFVALMLAVPLSLCTAIYLVEFAKRNFLTKIIEINLFNLASIPSVIYGVIGFVIYLQLFKMQRSSIIVGGLTLMLMSLPHLVITYMQALRGVPASIKDASYALGANKIQTLYFHGLRYASPGFLTGTILVLARIAGETAPLLLIGMIAFVCDVPSSLLAPATTIASQIYLWTESPEPIFVEMASAGIITLLAVLFLINLLAQAVRAKLRIKW